VYMGNSGSEKTSMKDVIIDVNDFCKHYCDVTAVDGISFDVYRGEIFGLLGPNGAGKTTTLESLEGLRAPDGGSLRVTGVDPVHQVRKLRDLIGVQLQTSGMPDRIQVGEAMTLFCAYHGIAPRFDLLDRLGLAENKSAQYKNKELESHSLIFDVLVNIDIYDREYEEVLKKLTQRSEGFDNMDWFIPNDLWLAGVYGYMGEKDLERKHYQVAAAILEKKVTQNPKDHRCHSSLGKAYAGLGRVQEAIREGLLGIECNPVEKDAIDGPLRIEDLARIYVMVGKYNEAIDLVERLLNMHSELSVAKLRRDPVWDPLRDHPRFKKLIESYK